MRASLRVGKVELQTVTNVVLLVGVLLALGRMFLFPGAVRGGAGSTASGLSARMLSAEDWAAVLRVAGMSTTSSTTTTVVEFVDVECPFCRGYADSLDVFLNASASTAVLAYAHLPLPQHRFAVFGARALECARSEHRTSALLRELLRGQDQIGIQNWGAYAQLAGIKDTAALSACVREGPTPAPVDSGRAVAQRIGITGTPGIVVNGYLFSQPPSAHALSTMAAGVAKGEKMSHLLQRVGIAELRGK